MEKFTLDIDKIIEEYAQYYTSTQPADIEMFEAGMAGFLHANDLKHFYGTKILWARSPIESMQIKGYPSDAFPRFARIYNGGTYQAIVSQAVEGGMRFDNFIMLQLRTARAMPIADASRVGTGILRSLSNNNFPPIFTPWQDAFRSVGEFNSMPSSLPAQQMSFLCCLRDLVNIATSQSDTIMKHHYMEQISKSAGGFYILGNTIVAVDRPSILKIDDSGRLHSTEGPAIAYRDGSQMFLLHGVTVDPRYILDPSTISATEVITTANVEVRRELVNLFGMERFVEEVFQGRYFHKDKYGVLYKTSQRGDEDIAIVKVINSTPEPDGTYKAYFLRVNPNVRTAHEAVASTFRYKGVPLTTEQYNPLQES